MNIPRYWARATETVTTPTGGSRALTAWGWSGESQTDAERHARRRLADLVGRVRSGEMLARRYTYGNRPPREQILDTLAAPDGSVAAILTRNAYGAVVLNAAQMLFVDVDLPLPTFRDRMVRFFGGPTAAEAMRNDVRRKLDSMGGSFRLYRTAGGLRVMSTDTTFTPGSAEAEHVMRELGADPAFVQLCRAQRSFRARLTPKPWRCGLPVPPSEFPRADPQVLRDFEDWLEDYEHVCAERATCALLESVGSTRVLAANAPLLRLHDAHTRAESGLPLA